MRVVGLEKFVNIIDWLNAKKFKYTTDPLKSFPFNGVYNLELNNKEEELLTRLTWGIV